MFDVHGNVVTEVEIQLTYGKVTARSPGSMRRQYVCVPSSPLGVFTYDLEFRFKGGGWHQFENPWVGKGLPAKSGSVRRIRSVGERLYDFRLVVRGWSISNRGASRLDPSRLGPLLTCASPGVAAGALNALGMIRRKP
jgi:hypothetical protein